MNLSHIVILLFRNDTFRKRSKPLIPGIQLLLGTQDQRRSTVPKRQILICLHERTGNAFICFECVCRIIVRSQFTSEHIGPDESETRALTRQERGCEG